MSKVINFFRDKHTLWYKFILYLFGVFIILFFLPNEGSFKYETTHLEGNPWHHDDLIAPFNFPIYKLEDEIAKEKSEVIKNRKFYFFRNLNINWAETIESLKNRVQNNNYKNIFENIIDTVFKKGIIETSEITDKKNKDFVIYLLQNNEEKEYKLGDFFTLAQANSLIESKLSSLPYDQRISFQDSILNYLTVSIFYNKEFSDKVLKQELANILPAQGMIKKGQSIIKNGEIVTADKIRILNSLKREFHFDSKNRMSERYFLFTGNFLLVALCLGMLMLFLFFFRPSIFSKNADITFIFILIIALIFLASKVSLVNKDLIYFVPFSLVPIIIRTFFDTRTALFAHLNSIIIASFLSNDGFSFVVVELFAGVGAIFSVAALSRRSQLFTSILAVFVSSCIAYFAVRLSLEASTYKFSIKEIFPFAVSSSAVLFAYPLIYLSEKLFGFISDFTLLELAGSNSALMRELATKAPGTFQHSLQVANLAEEAVYKIGGNPLLVRAGALHHDIGKIKNPRFFIENRTGEANPHDELPPEDSARIIIQHVIHGIELAKSYKLPDQIIDFIRTHHGTTATRYFFKNYQLQNPDKQIDESLFRYPGPIPFSKETAVLMMADSVEAASRSLKKYDAQSIDNMVDQIIKYQIEENQFLNSDITFQDITDIKKIFKKRLMNIYHVRIEYPR